MVRVVSSVRDHDQQGNQRYYGRSKQSLQQAQEEIFKFLLAIVKQWPAADALSQFKQIFFETGETASSDVSSAIYTLLFQNDEREFHNTLKRSCYILVNNWEVAREYSAIQELVELFEDPNLLRYTVSPTLKRLRQWMLNFIDGDDYKELQLYVSRFAEETHEQWSSRYTSYLLVPQYINTDNPVEQREAARALSRRLKDKFKFDLAMYTAHSQRALPDQKKLKNPTALGDSVLRLIKAIVAKRGEFSYKNLAHLFLEQVKDVSYANFKKSLVGYLTYSVKQPEVVKALRQNLGSKLDKLYTEHDDERVDSSLVLRTCNRVIDYLMTEDKRSPAPLFTLLLSQSTSILLAVLLLKLVLISRGSHHYLEARIADLIRYYEQFPREQCNWIINFLEVFQVTFAIHAENVEYNLISLGQVRKAAVDHNGQILDADDEDLEASRIFSRTILGRGDGVKPWGSDAEEEAAD